MCDVLWVFKCLLRFLVQDVSKLQFSMWHFNTIPSCSLWMCLFKDPWRSTYVQPSSVQNLGLLGLGVLFSFLTPSQCLEDMCLSKSLFLAVLNVSQNLHVKINPRWIFSWWNFNPSLLENVNLHSSHMNSECSCNSTHFIVPKYSHHLRWHEVRCLILCFLFIPKWTCW